jgi:L-lactate dehydrogenase
LLSHIEVRGRGLDEIEREDLLVITAGHHTVAGESRLDTLHQNLGVMESIAGSIEAGELPGIALVVTNPLDVMTEYLTRRWEDQPVAVMGTGTALETLRLTDRIARECGVHPRSVHAWVIGEHGDSCVFLLDSAVVGTLPLVEFAAQRGITLDPERLAVIERDVRDAAYEVRDLKGSAVQGIGLTVSGLVHALYHEMGALIPVSTRVGDRVSASLPCVLGPDGPSAPLWPQMTDAERECWERSLDVLSTANQVLPI